MKSPGLFFPHGNSSSGEVLEVAAIQCLGRHLVGQRKSTANRLEILSPESSSGCVLATVQRPGCVCHISLAAWGPSQCTRCQRHNAALLPGRLGDTSREEQTGPEKKQVMGTHGEDLFRGQCMGFIRASPTCATRGLPKDRQGLQVTPSNHIGCAFRPPSSKGLFL